MWLRARNGEMPMRIMGAYVMPIYYDMVPEEYKDKFAATLVDILKENDYCLDTGFLGTPCLFEALQKIGRQDLAYKVLYQDKKPSYMNQIHQGATTIWESWFVYDDDGNPMAMSLNHYAFGCVASWIYQNINGLKETEAGFKKFRIQPQPDDHLSYAKRRFKSVYGWIETEWHKENGRFTLTVKVPCNTTAEIILPDAADMRRAAASISIPAQCEKKEMFSPCIVQKQKVDVR